MSTDANMFYDDNTAYTGTTQDSANVIDHGAVGGRGPAPARQLYLVISCGTAWTNSTTSLTFTLEEDDNAAMSSSSDVAAYVVTTRPAAGELLLQVALPTITERYTQIRSAWTIAETTGTISAYVTDNPQANQS